MKKFSLLLLGIVFLLIVLAMANTVSYFILKVGGLQYESMKDLLKFALFVNLVGIPMEILLGIFPGVLEKMGKIKDKTNIMVFILGGLSTTLIIWGIDSLTESVYIPLVTIVIFSMGISLLEMVLVQKNLFKLCY